MLADRLGRRGVALSVAGLAALASPVPAGLAAETLSLALAYAAGGTAAVPPATLTLAEGVMRAMSLGRWKLPAVVMMTCGLAAGVIVAASAGPPDGTRGPSLVGLPVRTAGLAADRGEPFRLTEHGGLVYSVAFAPDGGSFASAGADGKVILWDAKTRKVRWTYTPPEAHRSAVAYSADGQTVAAAFRDGVRLLDAATGKLVETVTEEGSAPVSVAFAPDQRIDEKHVSRKLIFSNGMTTYVKTGVTWDLAGTVRFASVPGAGGGIGVRAAPLAVSPDGLRAVLTRHEKEEGKFIIWVWSAGSGVPNALLKGHTDTVFAAAWSKDGKFLATAGADGVIVWAAKPTGKTVKRPDGGEVDELEFVEHKRFELPRGTVL
jgi:WD40 repeat protein